ncbi:AbiH family protein [Lactobacillus ultunensis]|uniref:Bacteriophage abortive infection AbiH n=1 Tax=Lactobacillus ultunensis DSM 16047 TaxID=525365 RepID=C2EPM5_9LACO|nr:AbiH family protein [Lactobacillus ultunensis]EEJ71497.1 hypothetical protein HMPREF0548_1621 [Lactobacillus ultunensis DSM 16047]KRL79795.1 hypothetical protein FC57_GL001769 [Lactobacillus ultunensis DSM 16047]
MDSKEKRQLIVIGNGFDRQCGLETTYDNYFNTRFGIKCTEEVNKAFYRNTDIDDIQKDFYDNCEKVLIEIFKSKETKDSNLNIGDIINDVLSSFLLPLNEELNNKINTKTNASQMSEALRAHQELLKRLVDRSKEILEANYSKWDLIFLSAKVCLTSDPLAHWHDVETMIYRVVTWVLKDNIFKFCQNYSEDNENEYFDKTFYGYEFNSNLQNSKTIFRRIINICFHEDSKVTTKDDLAIKMLDDLNSFERNFAKFINDQVNYEDDVSRNKKDYLNSAKDLLKKLVFPNFEMSPDSVIIDVLNFNYSLDESDFLEMAIPNVHVNSWTNIHGIADYAKKSVQSSPPIFGIDSHDIFPSRRGEGVDFNDPRIFFTKAYRLINNHVNDIRNSSFQKNVDVITFMGHSLNKADYSYFETIFDMYDIFHSNVKLEFYYYKGYNKFSIVEDPKLKIKQSERETIKKVVNLLTTYGETLKNEHGENIVNKLMLEQRLDVHVNPQQE